MSLNENQPATFPCIWCRDGVHDLTREIEAIRNEGRCSVSMIRRRFKYGYAHALAVCRQLEARNWLVIEEGGCCALGKFFLSPQDGSEHADGVLSPNSSVEPSAHKVSTQEEVARRILNQYRAGFTFELGESNLESAVRWMADQITKCSGIPDASKAGVEEQSSGITDAPTDNVQAVLKCPVVCLTCWRVQADTGKCAHCRSFFIQPVVIEGAKL